MIGVGSRPSLLNHATHSVTGKSLYSVHSTRTCRPVLGSVPSKSVSTRVLSIACRDTSGCHAGGMPCRGLPSSTKEMGRSAAREKNCFAQAWLRVMSAGLGAAGMPCVVLLATLALVAAWIVPA